jgi:hypothetical protein
MDDRYRITGRALGGIAIAGITGLAALLLLGSQLGVWIVFVGVPLGLAVAGGLFIRRTIVDHRTTDNRFAQRRAIAAGEELQELSATVDDLRNEHPDWEPNEHLETLSTIESEVEDAGIEVEPDARTVSLATDIDGSQTDAIEQLHNRIAALERDIAASFGEYSEPAFDELDGVIYQLVSAGLLDEPPQTTPPTPDGNRFDLQDCQELSAALSERRAFLDDALADAIEERRSGAAEDSERVSKASKLREAGEHSEAVEALTGDGDHEVEESAVESDHKESPAEEADGDTPAEPTPLGGATDDTEVDSESETDGDELVESTESDGDEPIAVSGLEADDARSADGVADDSSVGAAGSDDERGESEEAVAAGTDSGEPVETDPDSDEGSVSEEDELLAETEEESNDEDEDDEVAESVEGDEVDEHTADETDDQVAEPMGSAETGTAGLDTEDTEPDGTDDDEATETGTANDDEAVTAVDDGQPVEVDPSSRDSVDSSTADSDRPTRVSADETEGEEADDADVEETNDLDVVAAPPPPSDEEPASDSDESDTAGESEYRMLADLDSSSTESDTHSAEETDSSTSAASDTESRSPSSESADSHEDSTETGEKEAFEFGPDRDDSESDDVTDSADVEDSQDPEGSPFDSVQSATDRPSRDEERRVTEEPVTETVSEDAAADPFESDSQSSSEQIGPTRRGGEDERVLPLDRSDHDDDQTPEMSDTESQGENPVTDTSMDDGVVSEDQAETEEAGDDETPEGEEDRQIEDDGDHTEDTVDEDDDSTAEGASGFVPAEPVDSDDENGSDGPLTRGSGRVPHNNDRLTRSTASHDDDADQADEPRTDEEDAAAHDEANTDDASSGRPESTDGGTVPAAPQDSPTDQLDEKHSDEDDEDDEDDEGQESADDSSAAADEEPDDQVPDDALFEDDSVKEVIEEPIRDEATEEYTTHDAIADPWGDPASDSETAIADQRFSSGGVVDETLDDIAPEDESDDESEADDADDGQALFSDAATDESDAATTDEASTGEAGLFGDVDGSEEADED